MHIHILGIAGTFMGSLALIAKTMGHQVTGMDNNIYPPMSTLLDKQNIDYIQGYNPANLPDADIFIIGNVLSRGNPCVERILNQHCPYTSGAQWLAQQVLQDKWVMAVAGTHGKTSAASMLAWILESAKLNPSFLIGGIAQNFNISARLTDSKFFIIEADEYDTAFFDKRSKFVHYQPKTLVINNLEFDHADIFSSLAEIQKQFHHLLRIIPNDGLIIYPENQPNINQLLSDGVWSKTKIIPPSSLKITPSGTQFSLANGETVEWNLLGEHNMQNALSAIHSAHHAGVPIDLACAALADFKGVKRRLELIYKTNNITLYDDFAHHPSAIKTTLSGLRAKIKNEPIIAILELRSNTMKMGVHQQDLIKSLNHANQILLLKPKNISWNIEALCKNKKNFTLFTSVNEIVQQTLKITQTTTPVHLLIMSNGNFDNIIPKLIAALPAS